MRSFAIATLVLTCNLFAAEARAQAQWLDGVFEFEPGLACVTWNSETTVSSYAGYWANPNGSFPKTGDVSYVHGVAAVVGNPCAGGDVIGFEFDLPAGAVLAVSANNPVVCIATRLSDGMSTTTGDNIHCSQAAGVGNHGGLYFGYAVVPHGWMFEIRVPVEFQRELFGMAGPNADNLKVGVETTNDFRVPEAWVIVPYRASVNYPSPSAVYQGGTAYRLTSFVNNYFKAGTVKFEMGSSSGIYDDGVVLSYPVTAANAGYSVYGDFSFPAYNGPVVWRAFIETTSGNFYGPEQTFTANGTTPSVHTLTVSKSGTGSGSVTSDPQGLSCGTTCNLGFTAGTPVTLTATADPGSQFGGWSGACAGNGACVVTMTGAMSVTANFTPASVPTVGSLSISADGLPGGAVAPIVVTGPSGFNQSFNLLSGTGQSLSSVPVGEYVGTPAIVIAGGTYVPRPSTLRAAVAPGGHGAISATYVLGRQLGLSISGSGSGSVVSRPAGLDCDASCAEAFADGEAVTLTAAPAVGSSFAGWSGACTGTAPCELTMTGDQAVTATFTAAAAGTSPLIVTLGGTGYGTVTSDPSGIDCGVICNFNFTDNTPVTLSAAPSAGSDFTGWSGACTGTGACLVTVASSTSVTATFAPTGTTTPPPSGTPYVPPSSAEPESGGCSQTGSGSAALGLGLLLWRRPRRRRA